MSADFGFRNNELSNAEYTALRDAANDGLKNQGAAVSGKRLRVTTQDGRKVLKYDDTNGIVGFFKLIFFKNEYKLGTISSYLKEKAILPNESQSSSITWLNTKLEKHNQNNKKEIIPLIAIAARTLPQPISEKAGVFAPAPLPTALEQERAVAVQEKAASPGAAAPVAQAFVPDAEPKAPEPTVVPAPSAPTPIEDTEPKESSESDKKPIQEEAPEARKPAIAPEVALEATKRSEELVVMPAPSAPTPIKDTEPKESSESDKKPIQEEAPEARKPAIAPGEIGLDVQPREPELSAVPIVEHASVPPQAGKASPVVQKAVQAETFIERLQAKDARFEELAAEFDAFPDDVANELLGKLPLELSVDLYAFLEKRADMCKARLISMFPSIVSEHAQFNLPMQLQARLGEQNSIIQALDNAYKANSGHEKAGRLLALKEFFTRRQLGDKLQQLNTVVNRKAEQNALLSQIDRVGKELGKFALEVDKLSDSDAIELFKRVPIEQNSLAKMVWLSLYLNKNDKVFEKYFIETFQDVSRSAKSGPTSREKMNAIRQKTQIKLALIDVMGNLKLQSKGNAPDEKYKKVQQLQSTIEALGG